MCELSRFSCVQLCATLWTVACQATLSMGFSRQEYWSRLLCPPPGYLPYPGINPRLLCLLHWQVGHLPLALPGSEVKVTRSRLTLCDLMDDRVHGILQARILEWVAFLFSRGSSQPRAISAWQVDSLPAEPQGKAQ